MEAIILAGGFGTRLRALCPNLPKPLAPIQGQPFLSHLMSYWKTQGVIHFILSVSYMYEKIVTTYQNMYDGTPISYAIEKTPLDTGGALIHALSQLKETNSPFLVLNGDTFFEVPLKKFFLKGDCSIALKWVDQNTRYSGVNLSEEGKILSLNEPSSLLINGGCYLFHPSKLLTFEKRVVSLEKGLLSQLNCFGKPFHVPFIDIGIPKDYKRCSKVILKSLEKREVP